MIAVLRLQRVVLGLSLTACVAACGNTPARDASVRDDTSQALNQYYQAWRGTPYAWGGSSMHGIDCSAFTRAVYADIFHVDLPRRTREQAKVGKKVSKSDLSPGDLLFFKTGWRRRHVGIYAGRGEFIHASESEGVTRSSLDATYWRKRFWKATSPLRG